MKRPNLLFVFPDQMRTQTLGFMGMEPVMTPNLDQFARDGLVLTEAVSNYPVCSPCRAMFMTGQYSYSNGVTSNCTSRSEPFGVELSEGAICWSDILKQEGYSLGYIGKWHLDSPREPYVKCRNNEGPVKWNEWCPPSRRHGFDYWYAYGTYDYHLRPMYWSNDAGREDFHYVDQWGPEHEADMATAYVNNADGRFRDPEKPFALVVSMNPPHMDYDLVPERYKAMYADLDIEQTVCKKPQVPAKGTEWGDYYRRYIKNQYAMVTGVDEQFGRILKALEDNGLTDNTLVVFSSDHGDCIGMHNEISKNNIYEESMRIPLLMRWPGKIRARQDDLLFSAPDLYPTLLGLMGLSAKIPAGVEGVDFSDFVLGGSIKNAPRSQLYLRSSHFGRDGMKYGARGVRTAEYSLCITTADDGHVIETLLFDRRRDPNQMENLAEAHPEIVRQLVEEELRPWLAKTADPWIVPEVIFKAVGA